MYHLAAQTSVFNQNKGDIIRDNIETFRVVCDACRRAGVKLVYASSSTAAPDNTTSLYGISKHFNEQYARCYNPHATGVRFHNVYGPNPRPGTLLWHLLNSDRVKLYNEGHNVRHFTFIRDIISSLVFAYAYKGGLLNAANPEATSTLQFAREVAKYKPLDIELLPHGRDFDKTEQAVSETICTAPLNYTSVADGIRLIMEK